MLTEDQREQFLFCSLSLAYISVTQAFWRLHWRYGHLLTYGTKHVTLLRFRSAVKSNIHFYFITVGNYHIKINFCLLLIQQTKEIYQIHLCSVCFVRTKRLKGSGIQHALCFSPVKLSPPGPCDHLKHLQKEQPLMVSKTRCWLYNRKSFLKIFIFVYHQKIKLLYKTETTKETINNSLKPQILTHKTRRHFIEVACVKVKIFSFKC